MKRRTPKVKESMVLALNTAIEWLKYPDMPILPGNFTPAEIARFLRTDIDLLLAPGQLQEKKYVIGDLQIAADYLSNPRIKTFIFPSSVASALRGIIRDLK
jgi:hypothetical protein